jgi:hypothetical protein
MRRRQFSLPLAAAILLVLALTSGYLYWKSPATPLLTKLPFQHRSPADTAKLSVGQEATNQSLQSSLDRVNRELDESEDRLRVTEARDHDAITQARRDIDEQRSAFQSQALQLQTQLLEGKKELAQSQALAVNAQREAEEQVKRADDLETNLAVARTELSDTTALLKDESTSLARERELLARGRDITDLMGARNLHILDVVDTDPRGKTRPAFGRIFFTEGKSLVFYAYDLNEAKMQKANYQYQVWAKKEGPNRPVRRLGIFYSDDKAQNRWVFKCDDANVINEIDSVFVTLGRPNSDPNRPGAPLMYAYLHGAPNHP